MTDPVTKRVTVVLAVKNEEKFLQEALNSILLQQEVVLEVIVVDDGSIDKTPDIVAELKKSNHNLMYLKNKGKGKVSAFNYGVEEATGDYVCLFAGDDVMPPGSMRARLAVAEQLEDDKPGCALFKIITMSEIPHLDGQIVPRAKGKGNPSGQSPLMNRMMIAEVFPVPENLPNEDTWIELAISYLQSLVVKHSDVVCCKWRIHENNSYNITMDFADYKNRIIERLEAYDLFLDKFRDRLAPKNRGSLLARIKCNAAYKKGSVVAVLFSGADIMSKLRALSSINPIFYNMRRRYYKLLSGW